MNVKFQPFVVAGTIAVLASAGVCFASAQEAKINFTCTGVAGGPGLVETADTEFTNAANYSGNPCVQANVVDNQFMTEWTQGPFVISSSTMLYNTNQGELAPGGVNRSQFTPPTEPSLTSSQAGGTSSITVTDPGGGDFLFDEVDLRGESQPCGGVGQAACAPFSYTITGINANIASNDFTVTCGGPGDLPCPLTAYSISDYYTTIVPPAYTDKSLTSLEISMTVPAGSRAYLDELFVSSVPKGDFSSVPEGGREIPYILLAFGVCFGAMLFKRRAHAGV